eukprot:3274770-Prymnesium_polylepis.1
MPCSVSAHKGCPDPNCAAAGHENPARTWIARLARPPRRPRRLRKASFAVRRCGSPYCWQRGLCASSPTSRAAMFRRLAARWMSGSPRVRKQNVGVHP